MTSFRFAFAGLGSLFKHEHNARLHLAAAILAITLGFVLQIALMEWLILVLMIAIVFISEILNSAIEGLADYVSPEYQEKIRLVKDYCAAAVLMISIAAAIVGLTIFIPRFLQLLANAQ